MSYADELQAVSVDEALIDVTSTVENTRRGANLAPSDRSQDVAKELAETIRMRVKNTTGCEGLSHAFIFWLPVFILLILFSSEHWYFSQYSISTGCYSPRQTSRVMSHFPRTGGRSARPAGYRGDQRFWVVDETESSREI